MMAVMFAAMLAVMFAVIFEVGHDQSRNVVPFESPLRGPNALYKIYDLTRPFHGKILFGFLAGLSFRADDAIIPARRVGAPPIGAPYSHQRTLLGCARGDDRAAERIVAWMIERLSRGCYAVYNAS